MVRRTSTAYNANVMGLTFRFTAEGIPLLLAGLVVGLVIIWAARRSSSRWSILAGALLAGAVAYAAGFRIAFIAAPGSGNGNGSEFLYLNRLHLSLPLTVLWIAAVTLSLRFLQTMGDDRLPSQVALVATSAFLTINFIQMRFQSPAAQEALLPALVLELGLIAVLIGVLVKRRGLPAEGLGFVLALISISGLLKVPTAFALLSPLLVLGAPLMTTSLSIAQGVAMSAPPRFRRSVLGIYLLFGWLSIVAVLLAYLHLSQGAFLILSGMTLTGMLLWREGSRALEAGAYVVNGKVMLLGVPLVPARLTAIVEVLEKAIRLGKKTLVMTPDTTAVMRAQRDPVLCEAYWQADLVTPDGIGLIWGARLLGFPLPERVTGIDLVEELCRRAAQQGFTLFLLGGQPGVAQAAQRRLERRFPGIKIAGTHHGYFTDDSQVLEAINVKRPNLLLVGLGVPRQELWMVKNRERLEARVIIGVGGSLDVLAGRVRRAPRGWQRLGLEWLYRVLRQPGRLPRALAIPRFLLWVGLLKLAQLVGASVTGASESVSTSASISTMSSSSS